MVVVTISDSIFTDFRNGFPRQYPPEIQTKRAKTLIERLESLPELALMHLEVEHVSWLLHLYFESYPSDVVRQIVSELPC